MTCRAAGEPGAVESAGGDIAIGDGAGRGSAGGMRAGGMRAVMNGGHGLGSALLARAGAGGVILA